MSKIITIIQIPPSTPRQLIYNLASALSTYDIIGGWFYRQYGKSEYTFLMDKFVGETINILIHREVNNKLFMLKVDQWYDKNPLTKQFSIEEFMSLPTSEIDSLFKIYETNTTAD